MCQSCPMVTILPYYGHRDTKVWAGAHWKKGATLGKTHGTCFCPACAFEYRKNPYNLTEEQVKAQMTNWHPNPGDCRAATEAQFGECQEQPFTAHHGNPFPGPSSHSAKDAIVAVCAQQRQSSTDSTLPPHKRPSWPGLPGQESVLVRPTSARILAMSPILRLHFAPKLLPSSCFCIAF